MLASSKACKVDEVAKGIPSSEPCEFIFTYFNLTYLILITTSICPLRLDAKCLLTQALYQYVLPSVSKLFSLTSLCIIVFIYTCPSDSTMKSRMLYSLGVGTTHFSVKTLLADADDTVSVHRAETSDPSELTESFFTSRVGLDQPYTGSAAAVGSESSLGTGASTPSAKIGGSSEARFARPKGPGRKR